MNKIKIKIFKLKKMEILKKSIKNDLFYIINKFYYYEYNV